MNGVSIMVSFLAPMLALILLLARLARALRWQPRGAGWCVGLGLLSLGVLFLPVGGFPLARVLVVFQDHWSVPLLAWLVAGVAKTFFNTELLRAEDRRAMWIFGSVSGLFLYPLALGLGPVDSFAWGWRFGPLFVVVGIVAMMLQCRRNRLGLVLLLTFCAWLARLPESGNLWDCLIDPVFFFASLGCLASSLIRKPKAV
ncbi:MAG: hypothetical protein EPO07_16945 [Verrucomicrobia bacterium]|nr:MAG: hypothetical protein EPO07_16945 [Verrucomicrobiota bacterium]